jgi:hypothetical protein
LFVLFCRVCHNQITGGAVATRCKQEQHMAMSLETKARRAKARKRDAFLNSLEPIAHRVEVIDANKELVRVQLNGCTLEGQLDPVNAQLERAGYRPVRLTSNLLNRESRTWAIDINTPGYMDPGSEAYHSM